MKPRTQMPRLMCNLDPWWNSNVPAFFARLGRRGLLKDQFFWLGLP